VVVGKFIKRYFTDAPKSWETLWFKSPPVAQSIPALEQGYTLGRGVDRETSKK
jgi:hypothetical protein